MKYFKPYSQELEQFRNDVDSLSIKEPLRSIIIGQFMNAQNNRGEITKKLLLNYEIGEKIEEKLTNSRISNLTLTSVGQVIGILYYERIFDKRMDMNIWIN